MKGDFERSVTSSANIFFGSALHEQVRAWKSCVILEDSWAFWGGSSSWEGWEAEGCCHCWGKKEKLVALLAPQASTAFCFPPVLCLPVP